MKKPTKKPKPKKSPFAFVHRMPKKKQNENKR